MAIDFAFEITCDVGKVLIKFVGYIHGIRSHVAVLIDKFANSRLFLVSVQDAVDQLPLFSRIVAVFEKIFIIISNFGLVFVFGTKFVHLIVLSPVLNSRLFNIIYM